MAWSQIGNLTGPQGPAGAAVPVPVSIANGGTGATSAVAALQALGALAPTTDLAGGAVTFGNPGTSPAGSSVAITDPVNLPGIIGIWGGNARSDIRFANGNMYLGCSSTNSPPVNLVRINASGALTANSVIDSSDARLKKNIRRDPQRYRGIRKAIELVLYDRINSRNDEPGVIAQEVQRAGCHADDFVTEGDEGILAVHYGKLALACALDPEGLE